MKYLKTFLMVCLCSFLIGINVFMVWTIGIVWALVINGLVTLGGYFLFEWMEVRS